MEKAFDNDKYLKMQADKIIERINMYDDVLYLEFGGKIFDDYHASRVLPFFEPDAKVKMLKNLKDKIEILIVINACDIQKSKMREDLGILYESEVLRLIEAFNDINLYVGSVVITQYAHQVGADIFKQKLNNMKIKTYIHYPISGYPSNINLILSEDGYGKNEYIETTRKLVVVTAPGPGSGKLATCLSQLYHENKRGKKAGYAKYETFPIWNLPLKHPVNLAYEAATVDLNDVNMIDPFHLDAYNKLTINYNRDVEAFPVLQSIFSRIYGKSPYKSPTDMGVNMVGYCIVNDDAAIYASKQEIIRRYFEVQCNVINGRMKDEAVEKIAYIMNQLGISVNDRKCVNAALEKEKEANVPSIALELDDGTIVTGKNTSLLNSTAAVLINAMKHYANIGKDLKLISPNVITPIQNLKTVQLGNRNARLHADEVLIALAIAATTNPIAEKALQQLPKLKNAQAHSTIILPHEDMNVLKKLKINITSEPIIYVHKLYKIE